MAQTFGEPAPYAPLPSPAMRMQAAWHGRAASDYRFDFWTALGWTLLSCGFFAYYVAYQLCRRMRDHNLRRLELLDAANLLAWERANESGRADEMRANFERSGNALAVLRHMTTDFRDPAMWLVIVLLSGGVGLIVLYVLLDQDLVRHAAAESAAEYELAMIYGALGAPIPPLPMAVPQTPHQYGLRVLALFGSCGLYTYWWLHDLMTQGNTHFDRDWAWEDAFLPAVLGR